MYHSVICSARLLVHAESEEPSTPLILTNPRPYGKPRGLEKAAPQSAKEDRESWLSFLRDLKSRGLTGVRLFVSDKYLGLIETLGEVYPEAKWQRCVVHFYRNVFTVTPKGKMKMVAAMLKAIHAQEDLQAAREKSEAVVTKLELMKLGKAAKIVREGFEETLSYYSFPREHWRSLRTKNPP